MILKDNQDKDKLLQSLPFTKRSFTIIYNFPGNNARLQKGIVADTKMEAKIIFAADYPKFSILEVIS